MKKAAHLIVVYFITLCVSTLITAFLYMIFQSCMQMVAADTVQIFSFYYFRAGCMVCFPFAALFALLVQVISAIRNQNSSLLGFLVYLFFTLFTWLLLLPYVIASTPESYLQEESRSPQKLSTKLFRVENTIPIYYLDANADGSYQVLYIKKDIFMAFPIVEDFSYVSYSAPFYDPLLETSVGYPESIKKPVSMVINFYEAALKAVQSGKGAWLRFASVGLSIFALWVFAGASRWKMVNVFFVSGMFIFLFVLHIGLYTSFQIHMIIEKMWQHAPFSFVSSLYVPVIVHSFFSLLFFLLGFIKRFKKIKVGGAE
ncbi:MAG TPA: hypothetical protein VFC68_01960 [Treponemataceae bacterium]|nr:hypothetical protein [Treponemataceae bacterium]